MIIEVWVKPGTRHRNEVVEPVGDEPWIVFVSAKPVAGDANQAVIELISEHFAMPKRYVSIKSGHRSRRKLLEISEIE